MRKDANKIYECFYCHRKMSYVMMTLALGNVEEEQFKYKDSTVQAFCSVRCYWKHMIDFANKIKLTTFEIIDEIYAIDYDELMH